MSANPIIYCLEHLTDYSQFERLCTDLMAGIGYKDIEPIGGTNDRGRDAIHQSKTDDSLTIFAYSVRSDWKVKLNSDCHRIQEENHNPTHIVFICTSTLSGSDKDWAKEIVKSKYDWILEIYDIERIRVLLTNDLRHLISQHPAIFCPPFFPTKGGLTITESKDTVIIDHISENHACATWLARKLSISGYKTWCYGLSPFVGEDKDSTIRTLLECRAVQYLPVISEESYKDTDFISRIGSISQNENIVIPCWVSNMDEIASKAKILQIEPARFYNGWAIGLNTVLKGLQSRGINPGEDKDKGKSIALRAYMPEPVTRSVSEKVYTNVFSVTVPKSILVCELNKNLDEMEIYELRKSWAFVKVTPKKFLSFDIPPKGVPLDTSDSILEYDWSAYDFREGKYTINVIKELVKRSLNVASANAGMEFCDERKVFYYPELDNKQRKIFFYHMDGRRTYVSVTGTKTYGSADWAIKFNYQLCPTFQVWKDQDEKFWVTTRVYVRVTNLDGIPFQGKEIIRKRKTVTKSWWNNHWLARTLGLMQGLTGSDKANTIEIGSEEKRKVSVSSKPLEWDCPISIDVEAVDRIGDFQEEMASARSFFDEDDIDEEQEEKVSG